MNELTSGGSVTAMSHKAEAHRGGGESSSDTEQWWAALGSREPVRTIRNGRRLLKSDMRYVLRRRKS